MWLITIERHGKTRDRPAGELFRRPKVCVRKDIAQYLPTRTQLRYIHLVTDAVQHASRVGLFRSQSLANYYLAPYYQMTIVKSSSFIVSPLSRLPKANRAFCDQSGKSTFRDWTIVPYRIQFIPYRNSI